MQTKQLIGYLLLVIAVLNLGLFMFTVTTPTMFWVTTIILAIPTFTMYRQRDE